MPGSQIWKSFFSEVSQGLSLPIRTIQLVDDYREAERKMRDVARHSLTYTDARPELSISDNRSGDTQEDINGPVGIWRNERLN